MVRWYAVSFDAPALSLDAMREKLRAHTTWDWQKRDSDLHGSYLRADVLGESPEVKLHFRVIPPRADVRYTGPETTAAEWEALGQRLIAMLTNAVGATLVTPIDAID